MGQDSLHVHTSPENIARIIETNLTAPLLLTRAVLRGPSRRLDDVSRSFIPPGLDLFGSVTVSDDGVADLALRGDLTRAGDVLPAGQRRLVELVEDAEGEHQAGARTTDVLERDLDLERRVDRLLPGHDADDRTLLAVVVGRLMLPAVPESEVVRSGEGGRVTLLAPPPEAATGSPMLFAWHPIPGAGRYRLEVLTGEGEVALEAETAKVRASFFPTGFFNAARGKNAQPAKRWKIQNYN